MGASVRAGIAGAEILGVEAAIVAQADQPLITAEILKRLVEENEETGRPIIASEYRGMLGTPALFAREFFGKLQALLPSEGCNAVILANLDLSIRIACPEAETDIDTPQDYEGISGD